MELATKYGVGITYNITDAAEYVSDYNKYDLIALIFMHLAMPLRQQFHQKLCEALPGGGQLIIEAFSPKQIHQASGGPKDPGLLYQTSQLREDFGCLRIIQCHDIQTKLNEGSLHNGIAEVTRFWGVRKKRDLLKH